MLNLSGHSVLPSNVAWLLSTGYEGRQFDCQPPWQVRKLDKGWGVGWWGVGALIEGWHGSPTMKKSTIVQSLLDCWTWFKDFPANYLVICIFRGIYRNLTSLYIHSQCWCYTRVKPRLQGTKGQWISPLCHQAPTFFFLIGLSFGKALFSFLHFQKWFNLNISSVPFACKSCFSRCCIPK